jgi:hypothetical protein
MRRTRQLAVAMLVALGLGLFAPACAVQTESRAVRAHPGGPPGQARRARHPHGGPPGQTGRHPNGGPPGQAGRQQGRPPGQRGRR